ncbi:MAG: rRNA maturation RNase YbeY [Candidatus Omnitrophota bacterium]
MRITIINRQRKIPVSKRAIKAFILKALEILKCDRGSVLKNTRQGVAPFGVLFSGAGISRGKGQLSLAGQLTIFYADNRVIQEFNQRFLGKNQPTDLLCFDLSGAGKIVADIVISSDMALENSQRFKTSPRWEMMLYLIHGILHLFGYRDYRKKDRERMHRKALEVLKKIKA